MVQQPWQTAPPSQAEDLPRAWWLRLPSKSPQVQDETGWCSAKQSCLLTRKLRGWADTSPTHTPEWRSVTVPSNPMRKTSQASKSESSPPHCLEELDGSLWVGQAAAESAHEGRRGVCWGLTSFVHHINHGHSWIQAPTFVTDGNNEAVGL